MGISKFTMATIAAAGLGVLGLAGCDDSSDIDATQVIQPLDYEFDDADLTKEAVTVHLGEPLFANINKNWKDMAQRLIVGTNALLDVPELSGAEFNADGDLIIPLHIPCQEIPIDEKGHLIRLCDGGKGKCEQDANGEMKNSCEIALVAQDFSLQPTYQTDTSGVAKATVTAALDTSKTPLSLTVDYGISASCDVTYKKGDSTSVSGGLKLSLDATSPNPIHFQLAEMSQGIYLDGLDQLDIGTSDSNTIKLDCGTLANVLLKLITPKTLIGLLSDKIQTAVKDAVDKAAGQPCTWPNENEKDLKGGTCRTGQSCKCFGTSTSVGDECEARGDYRCWDDAGKQFVSLYPGYDGRVKVGQFLSSFGADPAATFDFSALVGGTLAMSEGRTVDGVKTGSADLGAVLGLTNYPAEESYCVPPMDAPLPLTVTKSPNYDKEAPEDSQLGVVISEYTLNNALFQATRSGLLCLSLGSELSSMISSSLFSGFVPSLALLGDDLPMQLAVRPTKSPYITFGTNQVAGGKISDPLAILNLEGVEVDFYAMVEDRMTRLFTLGADISAPVAVEVTVDEETRQTLVHPVLGSLTDMITFNKIDYNSELLTEDIGQLGEDLSGLLSLADTIVAGILGSYPLPDVLGIRLSFDGFTGMGQSEEGPKPYVGGFLSISLPEDAGEESAED